MSEIGCKNNMASNHLNKILSKEDEYEEERPYYTLSTLITYLNYSNTSFASENKDNNGLAHLVTNLTNKFEDLVQRVTTVETGATDLEAKIALQQQQISSLMDIVYGQGKKIEELSQFSGQPQLPENNLYFRTIKSQTGQYPTFNRVVSALPNITITLKPFNPFDDRDILVSKDAHTYTTDEKGECNIKLPIGMYEYKVDYGKWSKEGFLVLTNEPGRRLDFTFAPDVQTADGSGTSGVTSNVYLLNMAVTHTFPEITDTSTPAPQILRYGIVLGRYMDSVGWGIRVLDNDNLIQYSCESEYSSAYLNNPISFKLSAEGKITEASLISDLNGSAETVRSVAKVGDKVIITMTNGNQRIGDESKIKFFDKSGGQPLVSISGVSVGDVVRVYDFLNSNGEFKTGTSDLDGLVDYVIKE